MYKFEKNGSWGEFLVIESNNLAKTIEYIKSKKIKNIWISKYHGYKLKNITFLKEILGLIVGLIIIDEDIRLDGIEGLVNLKMLMLRDETGYKLDFSNFKKLQKCNLLWNKNIFNLEACSKLEQLYLWNVNNSIFFANLFSKLTNVKELSLSQCKIIDLEFLSKIHYLEEFSIAYCPQLIDIRALSHCKQLRKLEIDHCKKIDDYTSICKLEKLTFLMIGDSAEITTLNFLKGLKKLKHFGFVGTNIKNGDLSPCIGIEHVGFDNKKHYSHTYEELNPSGKI